MKTIAMLLIITLSGCASMGSNYVPVVDLRGQSDYKYRSDLQECQSFARQRTGAAGGAVAGAAAGAVIGGLFSALLTPRGYRNRAVAPVIAAGAIGGGIHANETQEDIIKRCLHGRGYSVLN